ncbi:hypothetical protein OG937_45975 [Streptomyces sp. NBC_00510]
MSVDRWGHAMARKMDPSPESIAAAERAAAAARIHQNAGTSYLPPGNETGAISRAITPRTPGEGDTARKAIEGHWLAHGGADGPLGNPTNGAQLLVLDNEGGRASAYEGGSIYWWPDIGPQTVSKVVVRYRGMNCFHETNRFSGSDEPYFILGYQGDTGSGTLNPIQYDDVDAGGSFPYPIAEVYSGNPGKGLLLPAVLMEHDEGDPAHYHTLVATAVGTAAGLTVAAVALIVSVGAGAVAAPLVTAAVPFLIEALDGAIGSAEDFIDQAVLAISARQLLTTWQQPLQYERDVEYDLATPLLSGQGGAYKAYFDIELYSWD